MIATSRSIRYLPRTLSAAVLLGIIFTAAAPAQQRWVPDAKSSLAWWQINPHMNHLWATTCPEEPSWRPGEGRSGGWSISQALRPPKQGYAAVSDTTIIPLYPRPKIRSICTPAVTGHVMVDDPARFAGVRGEIIVDAEKLVGGEVRRDAYARDAILETTRYPDIRFTIDSVVNVRQRVDTVRGTAVGKFTMHGVTQPMRATVIAQPEPSGGMRVRAKFSVPADELVPTYNLSSFHLGLGVGVKIWKDLYMGVDLLMRPEGSTAND